MTEKRRSLLAYGLVVLFSALFLFVGHSIVASNQSKNATELFTANVITVNQIDYSIEKYGKNEVINQTVNFTAKVTSGEFRNRTVAARQFVDRLYPGNPDAVSPGDRIVLQYSENGIGEDSIHWLFNQYNRLPQLSLLIGIFLLLIVLISRKKSLLTILSLGTSCLAIFLFYLPGIMNRKNIYLITLVTSVFIITTSLVLIGGPSKKTLCSIIGNVGGVLISGGLAFLFIRILGISGVLNEDYLFLTYLSEGKPLDLRALIWSGITIGSLGAIMDVAMTIASALNELAENIEERSFRQFFKSGMNIGRDAIGTMVNTLILAYIGSSLAIVILLSAYQSNLLHLLNLEMILAEVLQAIAGSIGILAAVPLTVIVSSLIFKTGSRSDAAGQKRFDLTTTEKEDFRIGHEL